ncbi:MAG: GGDEF domain-containing protein [Thermodesulfobacteriota bacterium]
MRYTDMNLLEQMKISRQEITRRKQYLDFTEQDEKNLIAVRHAVGEHLDLIVTDFYDKIIPFPEMDQLIGDSETLLRLKKHQRHYILSLFDGQYDEDYVHSRLRIGLIHKRIGVAPKYYLSALHNLSTSLRRFIADYNGGRCEHCLAASNSLEKILAFDLTLVMDTYINTLMEEVRRGREELERYSRSLEEQIAERTRMLREQVRRDGLTGLLNQHVFYEELKKELSRGVRRSHPVSLVYFDLDGFKQLNDSQGHRRGDEILVAVADALRACLRQEDIAARYGGDEFCVILPESTAVEAEQVCRRIWTSMEDRLAGSGVTCSMGIASSNPNRTVDSSTLVKLADQAMYKAKREKGFFVCRADEL